MGYFLGKQDMRTLQQAQEQSVLLTNGLGGYASVTAAFSVPRCDQGILIAAVKAHNERITMVHRLRERLCLGGEQVYISSQGFARKHGNEEGFRHLTGFSLDVVPSWTYCLGGVTVKRTLCVGWGKNSTAVLYEIENLSAEACVLQVNPFLRDNGTGAASESPFLFKRKGFYYLMWAIWDTRCGCYDHRTFLFGARTLEGLARTAPLTMLPAHAGEIYSDESGDYLLSVFYPENGNFLT